jgi:RNA-binding protein
MEGKKKGTEIQTLKPTIWIGKQGVSPSLYDEIRLQLKVRKTIKVKWLRSVDVDPVAVAEICRAQLLQVRGRTMVLAKDRNE